MIKLISKATVVCTLSFLASHTNAMHESSMVSQFFKDFPVPLPIALKLFQEESNKQNTKETVENLARARACLLKTLKSPTAIIVSYLNGYDQETIKAMELLISLEGKKKFFDLELVDHLLPHGADINASTFKQISPLLVAIANQNTEYAQALIARRANVNLPFNGLSPLICALKFYNFDIVQVLVENNVFIDERTPNTGSTPLMVAAITPKSNKAIALLVAAEADTSLKNDNGHTALVLAKDQGNKAAVRLLKNPEKTKAQALQNPLYTKSIELRNRVALQQKLNAAQTPNVYHFIGNREINPRGSKKY